MEKIGFIGLGRMGSNIARRLIRNDHEVVGWDRSSDAVDGVVEDGMIAASGLADMKTKLGTKATFWVMLPAGQPTESTIAELADVAAQGRCGARYAYGVCLAFMACAARNAGLWPGRPRPSPVPPGACRR